MHKTNQIDMFALLCLEKKEETWLSTKLIFIITYFNEYITKLLIFKYNWR